MKTPKIMRFAALTLALLIGLGPASVVAQGPFYFWWLVQDERGEPFTGQNVQCSVYRPNTHTAAVIHTSSTLTAGGSSPLFSDANGKLHFYSASDAPVDLTCFYAHGGQAEINRFRTTDHKIVLPRQSGTKISRFSVTNSTTATNQSSGITLPQGALVRDVIIQNLAPDGRTTTFHISVGFAGNHAVAANVNALVDAQALTSPDEWLRPHLVLAAGSYGIIAAGNHRGVALSQYHNLVCLGGVCSGLTTVGGISTYRETPYLIHVASGLDVTYAINVPGVTNNSGARLHVFIVWQQFHTGINRLGRNN